MTKTNLTILITRPKEQSQILSADIEELGAKAIIFPTLTIEEPTNFDSMKKALTQLERFDLAIFTSVNAVAQTFKQVSELPKKCQIAAIGPATKDALISKQIRVDYSPPHNYSSEGLLAMDVCSQVENKNIIIFTGENARPLLAETLRQRGAKVTTAEVYRRAKPKANIKQELKQWQLSGIDLIISTSKKSLQNLYELVPASQHNWLQQIPLLVLSQRIADLALQLGFDKRVIVAEKASEDGIMAAVRKFCEIQSQGKITMENKTNQTKPETKKSPAENNKPAPKPPAPKQGRGGLFAALIVIVLILLAASDWYGWHIFRSTTTQLATQNNQLQNALTQTQQQLTQQQQATETTQGMIKKIAQQGTQTHEKWVLAEAEYLIRLANFNVALQRNIDIAIKLLNVADQRLQTLDDPNLVPVRSAIAANIASLQAIPKLDDTGIFVRLNALGNEITKLPLVPKRIDTKPTITTENKTSSRWETYFHDTLKNLQNIVIIQHLKHPKPPLLPPSQQLFLQNNIELQLSQAQWAALHQQPLIYQKSLQQATTWIQQYYQQDSSVTQSVLSAIANLQKINVKPQMPDISSSLQAIEKVMAS